MKMYLTLTMNTLDNKFRTLKQHPTAWQIKRFFNALPFKMQNIKNVKTDRLKKHLDRWLRDIPDTPKIYDYGANYHIKL